MPIRQFPPPNLWTPDGVVALGGDLHPESLLLAYRQGIFPWPTEGVPLVWFSPPQRAVLFFDELKVPARLARKRRNCGYELCVDTAFSEVIAHCADIPRSGQSGTWITPEMEDAYCELHRLGHAHSAEVRDPAAGGELIGGIYGVEIDGAFAGESMFHLRPDASKLALLHLIDWLRARGHRWLDIQVMTPHMKALGAREIPRAKFLELLEEARMRQPFR